jgi:hypothetical protein
VGTRTRVAAATAYPFSSGVIAERSALLAQCWCATIRRMKGEVRTGGCLCGAVRYSVRGDPLHVGRRHCADCRKESGSAFSVYAQWPVEVFEMTGEIASYDGRGFCARCGSSLLDLSDLEDSIIEIRSEASTMHRSN